MSYSDKVMDHYENPRNVGRLDKESSEVGTGMVGAPACGDVMLLQMTMELSKMLNLKPTDAEVLSRLPHCLPNGLKVEVLRKLGKLKTPSLQKNSVFPQSKSTVVSLQKMRSKRQ